MKNPIIPILNKFGYYKNDVPAIVSEHDMPAKTQGQVIKLVEHTQLLYKVDISHWRSAHQVALDANRPRRDMLMDVYQDAMLDTHLKSVTESRLLPVLNIPFEIVDEHTNEVDEDLTRLLTTKWFYKYLKAVLESISYGFTVVQLKLTGGIITDVEIVPRSNVVPEKLSILPDLNSEELVRFDAPGYNNLYTMIGEPDNMGLLLQAARFSIFKKHSLTHWQMFQRLFGIPMRIAKSNSRDKKIIAKIEANLKNMGSAMYAVMPLGTEIELKESASRDAFQVFKEGINVANKEVSKLYLGGTMTNEDGSSHSQAKEHGNSKNELTKADIRFTELEVNSTLFKQFTRWGVPLQGKHFRFNQSRKLPLATNQLEIDKWLGSLFELEPQYLRDTYGTVIGDRINAGLPAPGKEPDNLLLPAASITSQAQSYYAGSNICTHANNTNIPDIQAGGEEISKNLKNILDRIIKDIFRKKLKVGDIDQELLEEIASTLWADTQKGYGLNLIDIDLDSTDYRVLAALQENIYTFAAFQVHHNITGLTELLLDPTGKIRPENEFIAEALKLNKNYNQTWLKTNRKTVISSGQSTSAWQRWQEEKEVLPNVKFQTIGDKRTRKEHSKLEGVIISIDDVLLNIYMTPLDHNCRCEWVQTNEELKTPKELPKVPITFQNNPGKTGEIFTEDHPFFQGIKDGKKKEYKKIVKDLAKKTNSKQK